MTLGSDVSLPLPCTQVLSPSMDDDYCWDWTDCAMRGRALCDT